MAPRLARIYAYDPFKAAAIGGFGEQQFTDGRCLFCFGRVAVLCAIQPRTVSLHSIEEQGGLRTIPAGVRNHRNQITWFERLRIPSHALHETGARSLDIPRSNLGRVCRVSANDDDDVAVRVLPPILLYDAQIRNILGHIEHRARMMSEGWTSRS